MNIGDFLLIFTQLLFSLTLFLLFKKEKKHMCLIFDISNLSTSLHCPTQLLFYSYKNNHHKVVLMLLCFEIPKIFLSFY